MVIILIIFVKKIFQGKKGDYKVIGFPHRPDLDKGFIEAIETLHLLRNKGINVKMLIPEYMDKDCSTRANET